MAKSINRLTAALVKSLALPGYYADGNGLYLQVSKTGSKSWIFMFSIAGKRHDMGLGSLRDVSLAEARVKAAEGRKAVLDGRNPIGERSHAKALAQAKSLTFAECAAAYIEAHRPSWKNAKHGAQWESTLATYCGPIFGALPVAEVNTPLVMRALQPIWETKTETATRLRGRIESVLDWATVSGYRQGENPARWKGHLDNLLAKISKSRRTAHHPALPWPDLGQFMPALRQQGGVAAKALELAILTACRSGEVRGATWAEIDLEAALWTIPAERMKAGREHRVPLSPQALGLLRALPRFEGCELVFPGPSGKVLSDMSLTAVLRRMGRGDITVHGFRSTFRDWSAETTHYPREVCEHALAHGLPDKVEAAYMRSDLLNKRKELMTDWGALCGE